MNEGRNVEIQEDGSVKVFISGTTEGSSKDSDGEDNNKEVTNG